MKTNIRRLKMKHVLSIFLLIAGTLSAEASLLKRQTEASKSKMKVSEDAVASVSDSDINFEEWESDFNKSMKDVKSKPCTGKNCQFKKMQALDPSFEF